MRARFPAFAALLFVSTLAIAADTRTLPRIGLLANTIPMAELATATTTHPAPRAIVDGLRERGWIDGKNVQLVWRSAEGRLDRLPVLAEELVRIPVDVLVAWGPGVDAAVAKSDRIPIVMGASGVTGKTESLRIESLARPGHNVTGLTLYSSGEMMGKWLALLKQAVPDAARVAILDDTVTPFGRKSLAAARSLGMTLHGFAFANDVDRLEPVFEAMARAGMHAVIVQELPITNLRPTQVAIHRLAERHRLPVLHLVLGAADSGGLMSYGHDINKLYRRAPYFIDRILRGTKAGDIPIEQPAEFELRINLGAARAIGLAIPRALLLQADRVIE